MGKSEVSKLLYYDIPKIDESGSERVQYENPDFRVFARKNLNLANEIFPGMVIHYHKDVEMVYIRSGYASYRVNDKVIHLQSGEGLIVNSDQMHLLISEDVDYCLQNAINYLKNSEMSITEIAYAVGFNSASYFTKSFRQFYDMTPGEYRKKV